MARSVKGCGCAIAVLVVVLAAAGYAGWKYVLPWWRTQPPPASGAELKVFVLDVGPVNGDSILILSPTGKTILIDAGDTGKGKVVLDALKRNNIQQLDYLFVTHAHPDHMGAADEVLKGIKVLNIVDNGEPPDVPESLLPQTKPPANANRRAPRPARPRATSRTTSVIKFYEDYKEAVTASGAQYEKAAQGKQFDLGGGARLTVFGPSEPLFTRDQMKTGGNVPNANSMAMRLDYGDFSMMLTADAEEQSEHRWLTKDLNLRTTILKVAHHGSKYSTSQEFVSRATPRVAIVSCGEWNRYGHPSQAVLDRLKSVGATLYRTDMHGEISIVTRGRENDFKVTTSKEATGDVWAGRMAQKDDSTRSGFIAYGDFGPPPKPKKSPARK